MEKPYCFGNYSDCSCNECSVVKECIKQQEQDMNNVEYERSINGND